MFYIADRRGDTRWEKHEIDFSKLISNVDFPHAFSLGAAGRASSFSPAAPGCGSGISGNGYPTGTVERQKEMLSSVQAVREDAI